MPEREQTHGEIIKILELVKQREDLERVIEIEEQTVQLVVLLLDEEYYAFYGMLIKEIVTVDEISYVPGMPDEILGIINVRGDIESVLDLRNVLGLSSQPLTKQSRITIGEVNGIRSGVLVDSVEDVLEIPEDQILKPSSEVNVRRTEYVMGEASYKNHKLILLNLEKIFDNLLT